MEDDVMKIALRFGARAVDDLIALLIDARAAIVREHGPGATASSRGPWGTFERTTSPRPGRTGAAL
jgi:hypothetical protein